MRLIFWTFAILFGALLAPLVAVLRIAALFFRNRNIQESDSLEMENRHGKGKQDRVV